ncbi:MAG: energy transducer TonB [Prevotella sp.]|nr:energy transducer TonB [Prevotella sp.]
MMDRGKQTCKILKQIRKQIADANGIEYAVSECKYKGECLGTCPRCEEEVRYIEEELRSRRILGKAVVLAGISMNVLSANAAGVAPINEIENTDSIVVSDSLSTDSIRTKIDTEENHVLAGVVEQMPSFPGGISALMKFLEKNIHYPDNKASVSGRVIVRFQINEDGSIDKVRIAKSLFPEFDEEAIRVVKAMPRWIPGKLMGERVKVSYTLPITFRIK